MSCECYSYGPSSLPPPALGPGLLSPCSLPRPAYPHVRAGHLLCAPLYFSFIALNIINYSQFLFHLGLPVGKSLEDRHPFCLIQQCVPRA